MVSSGDDLTPVYYIIHETPSGTRYAYPAPKVPKSEFEFLSERSGVSWSTESGQQVVRVGGWLLSREPLAGVVASWQAPRVPGSRVKVTVPPTGVLRPLWDSLPDDYEVLTAQYSNVDAIDETVSSMYVQTWLDRPDETLSFDFSHMVPLPGEMPRVPADSRQWFVRDGSMLAVYGAHTAHLWPGVLTGFAQDVASTLRHRLAEYDLPSDKVYDYDLSRHNRESSGEVSVSYPIFWENPVSRPRREGERRRKGGYYDYQQQLVHIKKLVPISLAADSLVDALDKWDDEVDRWADFFVPRDGIAVACSCCRGKGFHLPGEVKSDDG